MVLRFQTRWSSGTETFRDLRRAFEDMYVLDFYKSTSHSPQALAWGHASLFDLRNRFNGFGGLVLTYDLEEPLKRFPLFFCDIQPQAKAWGE